MAPKTSQLLGLSPQELYAATFTALGEAGPGKDPFGVFSTILSRKQTGKYGKDIGAIVKAPSQFVANDPYSLSQVTDPNYGRKVYGSRYDQMLQKFEDPNQLRSVLEQHGGALQFRGQSLLKNKKPGDVMFDPKGNFYFQKDPKAAEQLMQRLGSSPAPAPSPVQQGNQLGESLLQKVLGALPLIKQRQSLAPDLVNPYGPMAQVPLPQDFLELFQEQMMI